jgi:type IV pilus assembly protein PilY1
MAASIRKRLGLKAGLLAACMLGGFNANAQINLAQVPLFIGQSSEPNITFVLDDSGSMHFEYMPGDVPTVGLTLYAFPQPNSVYGGGDYSRRACGGSPSLYDVPAEEPYNVLNVRMRSSAVNDVFYNPDIDYQPWVNSDGSPMPDADPENALYNPARPWLGGMDLTDQNNDIAWYVSQNEGQNNWYYDYDSGGCSGVRNPFWPITYYNFNGGDEMDPDDFTRVQITSTTPAGATFTSPGGITRTRNEEIQNFANWFQYHRSRVLTARAGIGRAFAQQGSNIRVGFGAINVGSRTIDSRTSPGTMLRGVRKFEGVDREDFFEELYEHVVPAAGTPLRTSLSEVGQYYMRSDSYGPWSTTPGQSGGQDFECRGSYTMLMTDGFWSGDDPDTAGIDIDHEDNENGPVITSPSGKTYQYTPSDPFRDNHFETLADVAMYFWKRDLRTDIDNIVPTTTRNPSFWQNMITYGIGLGVTGNIDVEDAEDALENGTPISWPDPFDTDTAKLDDLLHASINSRGRYFSAKEPDEFAEELSDQLQSLVRDAVSSSSSVAANSTRLDTETLIYQARFDSSNWSGELVAFNVDEDGSLGGEAWRASNTVNALDPGTRKVFTHDGNKGVPFTWSKISNGQRNAIDRGDGLGSERIDYLRGDQSEEVANGGKFRDRGSVLGDIINSNPVFSHTERFGYGNVTSTLGQEYRKFVNQKASRPPMVYVGGNDGMLHAFNALNGEELFSYVPGSQIEDLYKLTEPGYGHEYFVDGTPTVGDVYMDGEWRTILIGSMGAGGSGLFALDITNPKDFDEDDVLWEFSDPGMGEGVKETALVRMEMTSGNSTYNKWAVVFGNGYNSDTDTAKLFVLDAEDGSMLQSPIDTGEGSASNPNGMATPIVIDEDGDQNADKAYAGDLHGNVWKFDLDGSGEWQLADVSGTGNNNNNNNKNNKSGTGLLFVAERDGVRQPITSKPQVGRNDDADLVVYVGTGKYLEKTDADGTSTEIQSFYGLIDDGDDIDDRSDLLEQEIEFEGSALGFEVRIVSDEEMSDSDEGWYLDLLPPSTPESAAPGERVVTQALLRGGVVTFATVIPATSPCEFGGDSWLMSLDADDGSRLEGSVFDLNDDGRVDKNDFVNDGSVEMPASGRKSKVGVISRPTTISAGSKELIYTSGSTGEVEVVVGEGDKNKGRQSWRQLR